MTTPAELEIARQMQDVKKEWKDAVRSLALALVIVAKPQGPVSVSLSFPLSPSLSLSLSLSIPRVGSSSPCHACALKPEIPDQVAKIQENPDTEPPRGLSKTQVSIRSNPLQH
jgi:hypothetical protein